VDEWTFSRTAARCLLLGRTGGRDGWGKVLGALSLTQSDSGMDGRSVSGSGRQEYLIGKCEVPLGRGAEAVRVLVSELAQPRPSVPSFVRIDMPLSKLACDPTEFDGWWFPRPKVLLCLQSMLQGELLESR
jgi:hypothetical protein